ncbi:Polyadenylate-binding protein 1-b-binding protein, partial [Thalictrum thalictroides]
MDTDQQELKSIGFWGILEKTFKIIYKERMIFTKITLCFTLPLTIILIGYPAFNVYSFQKTLTIPLLFYTLFLTGIIFTVIFFLPPTAAIVYTITCIYTAKQFNFKTILRVVPKVWIRLMVTFAIQSLIMLAYNFVTILLITPPIIWLTAEWISNTLIILAVIYLIGFVYISIIWSLANVVTLLEDLKGYGAIKKSKALLKGKRLLASSLFLLISVPEVVGQIIVFVIVRNAINNEKIGYGNICLLVTLGLILPVLILLVQVMQTIFYLVCKSYHHEIIDKSYLQIHMDNFFPAAYAPPVERNVQLEHSN